MQDPSLLQNSSPHPTPMDSWESLKGTSLNNQPMTSMDVFPLSPQLFLILSVFWALYSSPHSPGYHHCTLRAPPSPPGVICFTGQLFPLQGAPAVSPQVLTCHHRTYCQSANMGLPSQGQVRVWQARHSPWVQNLRV